MTARSQAYYEYAETVLECKMIAEDKLSHWLERKANYQEDLAVQIVNAGLISSSELTHRLSQALKMPVASDIELEMFAAPHPLLGRDFCVDFHCIPLSDEMKAPFPLVVSNPFYIEVWEYVQELLNVEIKLYLAKPEDLTQEIFNCYGTQEEWEEYLVSQNKDPKQKTYPSHLNAIEEILSASEDDDNSDYAKSQDHLAKLLPNWSHHIPQAQQHLKAFKSLLDEIS